MLNNNHLLPIVIILIIGICFVSSSNDDKKSSNNKNSNMSDNNLMICLLIVGIVIFFIIQDNKKEGFSAPIDAKLCYRQRPLPDNNTPLVRDVTVHSPIGSPHFLTEDLASGNFPTVDGNENSPKHLFMFARNQARPECCPSTYSTSTGCVCRNENQDRVIQSRGGNQSGNVYPMDEVSGPYLNKGETNVKGMEGRYLNHKDWLKIKKPNFDLDRPH